MNTILEILVCFIIACVSFTAVFKVSEKQDARLMDKLNASDTICRACRKYRTMDCPNYSMCLATDDKPYFEPR